MKIKFKLFIITVLCFINLGCISVSPISQSSSAEDDVATSAAQRWEYIIAGQYFKAYEFLAPSIKSIKSPDSYAASFGRAMRLESAERVSVNCTSFDRCLVTFKIGAVVPVRGFTNQTIYRNIEEVWLFEDGRWGYFEK